MSPAARTTNATANTARLIPVAARACAVTWHSTRATAPNTTALSAEPTVMANESTSGRSPMATIVSAETTAMTALTTTEGDQGGDGRRVSADGRCPQELGSAGLLLGASVPDDVQDAHDGQGEHYPGDALVRHRDAGGVVVHPVTRAAHDDARRRLHHSCPALLGDRVREQGVEREREVGVEARHRHGPHAEADAVAAHDEPDELPGAGECASAALLTRLRRCQRSDRRGRHHPRACATGRALSAASTPSP